MEEEKKTPHRTTKTTTTKRAPKDTVKAEKKKQDGAPSQSGAIVTVGRRKSAIARVRMLPGTGTIVVNGKEYKTYFPIQLLQKDIERPLTATSMMGTIDVACIVSGGGFRGQAEALRLGIARGLILMNPDLKKTMRSEGLITRDSRVKERKKPGLKRARRAPQFSKR